MFAIAAFPPLLLLVARLTARNAPPPEIEAILVYILSPCVACMMSVFLPGDSRVLASELEGRSWVYLAVRPYGPLSVLLGKYLVAVSWALPVGLISATLGSIVLGGDNLRQLIAVQCGLACLSCLAYSAVFLLIGVVAPKRAMVMGVVYAVGVEVVAASIPAAVNMLTIQHRMRCLLVRGMEMDVSHAGRIPYSLHTLAMKAQVGMWVCCW